MGHRNTILQYNTLSMMCIYKVGIGFWRSDSSIGSDNGLAPTRRQAIIWSNDDQFTDACMHHSD